MKRLAYIFLALFIISVSKTRAQSATSYQLAKQSTVKINGSSNIHDWDCTVNKSNITATFDPSALQNSSGNFLHVFDYYATVKSIKCGHGKMNRNTYDALKAKKDPTIMFTVNKSKVTDDAGSNSSFTLQVTGELTIAGVKKTVSFPVKGQLMGNKDLHFTGSYKFDMTNFNVTPPSIMFGAIKVAKPVTINFNITLAPTT
ncbi:MAG TPA: YceI family protein [Balneolaceae bacterium]|nr:YceI family protein [Balneolaceae bacterium]